jgi:hypothetical protein
MLRVLLIALLFASPCFSQGRIKVDVESYSAEFPADGLPTKLPLGVTLKYIPPAPAPTPTPTPTPIPPATNELSIVDFGAKANDSIDDTAAINRALAAGKSHGKTVRVPAGVFRHNDLLYCDSVKMIGVGDASELIATNFRRSAIYLRGKKPIVESIKHSFNTAGVARQSHGDTCSLFVEKSQGFLISDVTVVGSPSAGIMNWGAVGTAADPCVIKNCRMSGTLADGIHNTNATNFVRVEGCTVSTPRDDGIAVVSYMSNGTPCRNILIADNTVSSVSWGRGITVVGGEFVEVLNNKINRTTAAGVYLVAEANEWNTFSLKGVTVKGNTIERACYNDAGAAVCPTGHPGVLIAGRIGMPAQDLLIERNTILAPATDGIRVENHVARVRLVSNAFVGIPSSRATIRVVPTSQSEVTIVP